MKQFYNRLLPAVLLASLTLTAAHAEEPKAVDASATPAVEPAPAPAPTGAAAPAAAPAKADFAPFQLLKEGQGAPAVARALTRTFMTDEEFKAEVSTVRERFADFEKDTQRDMTHYLNDRLVIHGLAAANGKIERIKKGLVWLSMYGEFQTPPPAYVEKFIKDNIDSLTALFQDFNWERASDYIKNRGWRKKEDGEEKKTASVQ